VKLRSKDLTSTKQVEICYVLLGEIRDGTVNAKMSWRKIGSTHSVQFDWSRVMKREEDDADVAGFYHTHPEGFTDLSSKDESTMRAWAFCFGKPLICAIGTSAGIRAWCFEVDGNFKELKEVKRYKRTWLTGIIDNDGES
jgi:proteasome lid subunit RPN8/RPN11